MENNISKKIDNYLTKMKENILNKATELDLLKDDNMTNFIQYIYDYDRLILTKEDFQKRKRVKTFVPMYERCCAKRATNEQCSRRRLKDSEYCGTHKKGTPYGSLVGNLNINEDIPINILNEKIEVWSEDIMGIIYYIDGKGNVYDNNDILSNKINPRIIARYKYNNNKYSIPELGV